jgi:hypothetical protein
MLATSFEAVGENSVFPADAYDTAAIPSVRIGSCQEIETASRQRRIDDADDRTGMEANSTHEASHASR